MINIPSGLVSEAVSSIPVGFRGILVDTITDSVVIFDSTGIISTIPTGTVSSVVGTIDASTNPNYPASQAGNVYVISVAGKIGGASGAIVAVGDFVLCLNTNLGGTEAAVGSDFNINEANIDLGNIAITGGTIVGLTALRSLWLEPPTTTDPLLLRSQTQTVAGASSQNASLASGAAKEDVATGGNSGQASVEGGRAGDSSGVGGAGGNGGNAKLLGGLAGNDTEGSSGTGGRGGDVQLVPGSGGTGATNGKNGFIDHQGLEKHSIDQGINARAGGGQANATLLGASYNKVTVVTTAGDSVKLPDAEVGMVIVVMNSSAANDLDLFPATGDNIDSAGVNIALPVAVSTFVRLVCYVATEWELN